MMRNKNIRVNLDGNPGLKRRLELLNNNPLLKKLDGLTADEVRKLPESDKAALRQAVDDAIRQAQQEEELASNNQSSIKGEI
jgi:hypothetical protein